MKLRTLAIVGALLMPGTNAVAAPDAAAPYRMVRSVPLGPPDRWDYVVFDPGSGRVYVAHGDQVAVVDGRTGAIVGRVEGMPGGTHGVAISKATGQGFTDDGRAGQAVAFDLQTLKVTRRIKANDDADGAVLDDATGHVFIVEGDPAALTVIDPKSDAAIATINVGEKLEYAAADGAGTVYVAGEEKGDVVKIDARTNKVVAHWPTPACKSPHGLALDKAGRRLFMGCANAVMTVVDADTGRVVADVPIGRGNDAVAWDGVRRRAFSSNGVDGTVSVYQQTSPDAYRLLATLPTKVSGRTMDVDPASGRLFVAAADTDPNPVPGKRPVTRPGTLSLLMLDPTGK